MGELNLKEEQYEKLGNFFPRFIVIGFLLISILFSAISTNFEPLFGKVNSEKGQSRKICSHLYDATPNSANDSVMMHINKLFDECLGAKFYSVKGSSLFELQGQYKFKDETGDVHPAVTKGSLSLDQKLNKKGLIDGSSTIRVDTTIEIPSCDSDCTLSPAAKTEWERFIVALLEHEYGHVERIHQYFDGMLDKVVGKTPDEAEQVIDDVNNALTVEQEKYERETNHGVTQGVILDYYIK